MTTTTTIRHTLAIDDLRELIASHQAPCASIYVATRRGSDPDARQRYEGLLREARERGETELHGARSRAFFEPLEALGADQETWRDLVDGLAVFRSNDFFAAYALSGEFADLAILADSFHVRPLLRHLQSNHGYYLLSVGQNHVGFFRGDADGLVPVRVEGLPASLVDALGLEDRQKTISSHSSGGHGNMPIFHGQGKEESSRDEDIARFLRVIDKSIWPVLRDERSPLILAATERLHPTWHSITRYAHATEEGVRGNFERASLEDLHERAWPIVRERLRARDDEVRRRYDQLVGRARALDEIRAVATFAVQGRVHELLLARDARIWGRLDPATGALELHGEQQGDGDDDVLDDVAEAVLVRGGQVISLATDQMPTKSPIAAILRW